LVDRRQNSNDWHAQASLRELCADHILNRREILDTTDLREKVTAFAHLVLAQPSQESSRELIDNMHSHRESDSSRLRSPVKLHRGPAVSEQVNNIDVWLKANCHVVSRVPRRISDT